jgi:hypothetical protein
MRFALPGIVVAGFLLVSCGPSPVVLTPTTSNVSVVEDYYFFDLDGTNTDGGVELSLPTGSGTRGVYLIFTNSNGAFVSAPKVVQTNAIDSRSVDGSREPLPVSRSRSFLPPDTPVVRDAEIPQQWQPELRPASRGITVPDPHFNVPPGGPLGETLETTRTFYGLRYDGNTPDEDAAITATLRRIEGDTTNTSAPSVSIYVEDSEWSSTLPHPPGSITQAMVDALADQFLALSDADGEIYDWVTDLYGAPWSSAAAGNPFIDFHNNVTILLHNIESDGAGGIVGYFWSKDNYLNSALADGQPTSNERIMFYLDSETLSAASGLTWDPTDFWPESAFSTLAHEFQHMIHFHQRNVLSGTTTQTWINELMSQVTEDIVADKLGIDGPRGVTTADDGSTGNFNGRLPRYNYWNDISLSGWGATGEVLDSYSISYAFGAYLARNYGGATFLQAMMESGSSDPDQMILSATGRTMGDHLWRWGLATLRSDASESVPFQMNPGIWMTSSAGSTSYNLGSINHFNYTYTESGTTVNGPWVWTSLATVLQMPPLSKLIYYAGTVSDGTVQLSLDVPAGIDLTVVME